MTRRALHAIVVAASMALVFAVIAVVHAVGGAGASTSTEQRSAIAGLTSSQLHGIALRSAEGAGDAHPGRVEAVRTTYEEALKLVYGALPPGVSDPSKSVYEITMTGHFTGYDASVPAGASLPTGTEQTLIVDRYGNATDAWLNNRPEPALAQAGPVIKLSAKTPAASHSSRP